MKSKNKKYSGWNYGSTKTTPKTEKGIINRIYKNNKERIDRALEGSGPNLKKTFEQLVRERMNEGKTLKQALKKMENSNLFTSPEERGLQSMLDYMPEHQKTELKKLLNKKLIKRTDFSYNSSLKMYIYKNPVYIYKNGLLVPTMVALGFDKRKNGSVVEGITAINVYYNGSWQVYSEQVNLTF